MYHYSLGTAKSATFQLHLEKKRTENVEFSFNCPWKIKETLKHMVDHK